MPLLLVFAVVLAGCGGAELVDAGMDTGMDAPIDAPLDVGGPPSTDTDVPASTCVPRSLPTTPSSVVVSSGPPGGPQPIVVHFPDGAREGELAILSYPLFAPYGGFYVSRVNVDGGAVALEASNDYDLSVFRLSGTLDVATGIATGIYGSRLPLPSYPDEWHETPFELCHVGPASITSTLTWVATGSPRAPLETLRLVSTVPLAADAALAMEHAGVRVPLEVTWSVRGVTELRPTRAWPFGELTLVVDGTDVMHARAALPEPLLIALPEGSLTDLTLDTPPPPDAVIGEWLDGALRAGIPAFDSEEYRGPQLAAGLGSPPPSARSVRASFVRTVQSPATVRAAIVTADGATAEFDLTSPSSVPFERVVALPGPGPLYLVVAVDGDPSGIWTPPSGGLRVTELAFE